MHRRGGRAIGSEPGSGCICTSSQPMPQRQDAYIHVNNVHVFPVPRYRRLQCHGMQRSDVRRTNRSNQTQSEMQHITSNLAVLYLVIWRSLASVCVPLSSEAENEGTSVAKGRTKHWDAAPLHSQRCRTRATRRTASVCTTASSIHGHRAGSPAESGVARTRPGRFVTPRRTEHRVTGRYISNK